MTTESSIVETTFETKKGYEECEHCQSVLSPAAYFVKLVETIEKYIFLYDSLDKIEVEGEMAEKLLCLGYDSVYRITDSKEEAFINKVIAEVISAQEAKDIYSKAQQCVTLDKLGIPEVTKKLQNEPLYDSACKIIALDKKAFITQMTTKAIQEAENVYSKAQQCVTLDKLGISEGVTQKLQRLYDSACKIIALDKKAFITKMTTEAISEQEAENIYSKAQQCVTLDKLEIADEVTKKLQSEPLYDSACKIIALDKKAFITQMTTKAIQEAENVYSKAQQCVTLDKLEIAEVDKKLLCFKYDSICKIIAFEEGAFVNKVKAIAISREDAESIYQKALKRKEFVLGQQLKTRRPDLFEIKLDCDSTNKTKLYLEIVNDTKPHK